MNSEAWSEIQIFALLVALSGSGVSSLVLVAARTLRQRSAPLRYGVLFGGVIGLLAAPALVGAGFALQGMFASVSEEIVRIPAERLPEVLAPPAPAVLAPIHDAAAGPLVELVLVLIWAFGTAVGLLWLLRGHWRQSRAIFGEDWRADWWTDERRRVLAQTVGLRAFPRVCRSPVAPMPMVVGLWRPLIVLPASAPVSWDQPQWEAVLLHEAAHIARCDPWAVLAQRVAVLLFWWCPLVHLLGRRLNDLRESICDDYALEGQCDRLAYAEILVETAERLVHLRTAPVPVGLLDSARGGLEERITRLLEKEKRPMTKLSRAGKLLGAAMLTAACLAITAATAFSQAPVHKKIQIKIVIDGKEFNVGEVDLAALIQAAHAKAKPAAHSFWLDMGGMHFQIAGEKKAQPKFKSSEFKLDGLQFQIVGEKKEPAKKEVEKGIVWRFSTGGGKETKADPRIEALVKQAEAIKPGSGAAIRKALEKHQGIIIQLADPVAPKKPKPPMPPAGGFPFGLSNVEGTFELHLDDGKVLKMVTGSGKAGASKTTPKKAGDALLHQALAAREAAKANLAAAEAHLKALQTQGKAKGKAAGTPFELHFTVPTRPTPPTPPAANVDALARQLERISAELRELRMRLDANKK